LQNQKPETISILKKFVCFVNFECFALKKEWLSALAYYNNERNEIQWVTQRIFEIENCVISIILSAGINRSFFSPRANSDLNRSYLKKNLLCASVKICGNLWKIQFVTVWNRGVWNINAFRKNDFGTELFGRAGTPDGKPAATQRRVRFTQSKGKIYPTKGKIYPTKGKIYPT